MRNPTLFPKLAVRGALDPTTRARTSKPSIPTMRKGTPTIPDELIAHARWAYDHGWTVKAVSAHFGWGYKYAYKILAEGLRPQIDPAKPDWWK